MYPRPRPSLSRYLRTSGKIGAFVGVGLATIYAFFVWGIAILMADLILDAPVGEIITFIALLILMGIGYFVGMIVGFIVWMIAITIK